MPTYRSPLKKALRRLEPMARRAGASAHRLRKAMMADEDVLAWLRKIEEDLPIALPLSPWLQGP
ncbi:hypothetical protein ACFYZH_12100 [Streptomyces abikoensis]|uniref:hypothetical protein n=1 Tax=Streptomyces abikoensis TaxID=97398 RepID=UPI003680084D